MSSSSEILCQNEIECFKPALHDCHHCTKRLCLGHINDHNELIMVRVRQFFDEMNVLTDSITNLNTKQSVGNARNKLNQWREEHHQQIERIYEVYSEAIHRSENELNNRLHLFKGSFDLSISYLKEQLLSEDKNNQATRQDVLAIEAQLNQLHACLQSLQCGIDLETKDLSWENHIRINTLFTYQRELLDSYAIQSYRTATVENLAKFVSSKENQIILWLDQQQRLHLMDRDLPSQLLTLPEFPSNYQAGKPDTDIIDIKWCSFAEVFLILFRRYLYSFHPKTSQFTLIPLTRYKNYPFCCITCLNESLIFISYSNPGICIEQWKYSSTIECLKHWDNLTDHKSEWICSMNTDAALRTGLLVRRGETVYRRFELRDETLQLLRTVPLEYVAAIYPFRSQYWFLKNLCGKYYVYSTETNEYHLSKFDFPFGLDEFGTKSIIIGSKQNELSFYDI